MRPDEHDTHDDMRPRTPRRSFELFFFESSADGRRTHLRFTRLGVTVILLLTIVPLIALLVIFLTSSRRPMPDVNTNVRTLPASPYPAISPVIRPAPPPSLPKSSRRPESMGPASPSPRATEGNSDRPIEPGSTPKPRPSESPP